MAITFLCSNLYKINLLQLSQDTLFVTILFSSVVLIDNCPFHLQLPISSAIAHFICIYTLLRFVYISIYFKLSGHRPLCHKVSQVINSPLPSPDQYFQNKFQAARNGQKLISHCDNYFLSDQMAHFVNHLFSSSIFNILVPPKFLNYPYIVTFNCPAIFSILSFLFIFNFFTFYASSIQLHSLALQ